MEFTFKIPCTMHARIEAPTPTRAREIASAWQEHAHDWEEFTTDHDPAEHMEGLAPDEKVNDATVWVELEVDDQNAEPTLIYVDGERALSDAETLLALQELLWPKHDPNEAWTADTIDQVAAALTRAGYGRPTAEG